jgi:hypothetical protein
MQKVMQLVAVVLLGVIAAALVNSRGKSESIVPPTLLTESAASGGVLPGPIHIQPFQTQLQCDLDPGNDYYTVNFPVPSKRLVIQTVSMYRETPYAGTWAQIYVITSVGGVMGTYALPYIGDTTISPYPAVSMAAVIYADAGSTVYISCGRTGTSGSETDVISVSGYLMDL